MTPDEERLRDMWLAECWPTVHEEGWESRRREREVAERLAAQQSERETRRARRGAA